MNNIPPKEIANAIFDCCFDHKNPETVIDGATIEARVWGCWQKLHFVLQDWLANDEQGLIDYIKKHQPVSPNSSEWNELFG